MPVNEQKAREQFERYAHARDNGHMDFVKLADKCEDYFVGQQWDPIVKRRLENQGKPVLTINKILATLATVMGEQLANRADISFRPLKEGTQEVADALTKVYIQITNENKMDWIESEVSSDGFISGRGFYDVRVGFDDQTQGKVEISRVNPRNVLIDPDAEDYDPDTWKEVFITKWLTIDDIKQLYGEKDAKYLKAKGFSDFMYGYDSIERFHKTFGGDLHQTESSLDIDNTRRKYRVIERQYKKLTNAWHFVDIATGDTRVVPDNWSKEKRDNVAQQYELGTFKKLVEQVRWTVTCDNVVLFDEWSPFKSFTIVPYFPYLRNGKTLGIVENLISPQDQLNKASSQELHIINTTANSGWKVKTGALTNMDIEDLEARGAETGLVVELDDINSLEKITPNTIPSGLDRVSYKSDEYIKEISGISDSARGMDRADVAAKAIQAKQAAGSVNLAKPLDNLARTRHLVAQRVLNLVQTYYTEERVIQVLGQDLTAESEEVEVNKPGPEGEIVNDLTLGEYGIVITTVPARANFEETQFQEALELRKLGINIPDDVLVENSHLARKGEIAKRIQAANGGGEQSEEEKQMAQLEMELKQLENQEKQANIESTQAASALSMVRAKKEALDAQKGDPADNTLQIKAAELEMQRQLNQATMQNDQERLAADIQQKRNELAATIELKRIEAEEKSALAEVMAEHKMRLDKKVADQKIELDKAASDAKIAAAKETQTKEAKNE